MTQHNHPDLEAEVANLRRLANQPSEWSTAETVYSRKAVALLEEAESLFRGEYAPAKEGEKLFPRLATVNLAENLRTNAAHWTVLHEIELRHRDGLERSKAIIAAERFVEVRYAGVPETLPAPPNGPDAARGEAV